MQGTTVMYEIIILNFDEGSYLCMTTGKVLSKAGKDKKDLYIQAYLERRNYFTPMVYSADEIPGPEALAA